MNSRPIVLPGYHQVFTAAGAPAGVSRNRSSASSDGLGRCALIVRNKPYVLFVESFASTCITFLLVVASAKRNTYVPGGSVTPGNSTGVLNVNSVRESIGPWAWAGAVDNVMSIAAAAHAEVNSFLRIISGPPRSLARCNWLADIRNRH